MLINRTLAIVALLIVGLLVVTIGTWFVAFNPASNDAAWSLHWLLQRLPIAVGLVMVIAGFRLLSATPVQGPVMSDDDPAP